MRIHIVSIAGAMTANIAADLVRLGHQVSGSDQDNIFPPVSDILKKSNIEINIHPVTSAIDLAIIGSSYYKFDRTKSEFEQIKKLNIPFISATEYIAQNTVKKNSILIAGSYGKSTITSLVAWILINAQMNPSLMIGAQNINDFPSYTNTPSDYSVIEADESIHGLDTKAKFLYYPSKYLLISSSHWEHKDCYSSSAKNQLAYQQLINQTSPNGFIVINQNDISNHKLNVPENIQKITYNTDKSDYYLKSTELTNHHTLLTIHTPDGDVQVNTQLLGHFNFENILAAFALTHSLQIPKDVIIDSIQSYLGIKRRLEIIKQNDSVVLIDDFAQSAPRIESAIKSIKFHFPKHQIISIFEPHAGFLQHRSGLENLDQAFQKSHTVILSKLRISPDKSNRITARDYQELIGNKLIYLPNTEDIINYLKNNIGLTVIINFSSGGIKNHQLLDQIKTII